MSHRHQAPVVRCAVYTRKSTEEGLEQEFNTLDAQRESGEAYIRSQAHEGWVYVPKIYDDGGFTGGNTDRPALRRLLADIEAGLIDCVVVYKVDRLSRSLLDFAKMLEIFERHQVAFVSVTQQFNTTTSMGRLMLNVLLSFAQFEREIISERTRDKIAATRRKGKWSGGMPLLGYDVDVNSKLIVNQNEAERVRVIFNLYLQHAGLIPVVQELERRGWRNKQWTTRKGSERGGKLINKTSLHKLLTNVTYLGKLAYKDEVHEGEHEAIVDESVWQNVQQVLQRNKRTGTARNKSGAFLKGVLRCTSCDCAMSPTYVMKDGNKRYRYYVCSSAQKFGWSSCPSPSVPAGEMERFVVEQIRCIGQDSVLVERVIAQVKQQAQAQTSDLDQELRLIDREMAQWNRQIQELLVQIGPNDAETPDTARLADLHERIRSAEQRRTAIVEELSTFQHHQINEQEAKKLLAIFDPVWETLTPHERSRVIHLLVERVDYDGENGKLAISFHPTGIQALQEQAV
jgi:site-specific DNA recombinase